MKVLIVGSGGREHAIVHALSKSKKVNEIYAAPGNAGIAKLAMCVNIKDTDVDSLVEFAKAEKIDLVVVGSNALVASSHKSTFGFVAKALAIATLCFCPPES